MNSKNILKIIVISIVIIILIGTIVFAINYADPICNNNGKIYTHDDIKELLTRKLDNVYERCEVELDQTVNGEKNIEVIETYRKENISLTKVYKNGILFNEFWENKGIEKIDVISLEGTQAEHDGINGIYHVKNNSEFFENDNLISEEYLEEKIRDLTYLGRKVINGKETIVIKEKKDNEPKKIYYYDEETGYIILQVTYNLFDKSYEYSNIDVKLNVVTDNDVKKPVFENYLNYEYRKN